MEQTSRGAFDAVLFQPHASAPETSGQTLEAVYSTLARDLAMQLSAFLRFSVTVTYSGAEDCTFAQYLSNRRPNGCAAPISASHPSGTMLLDLDHALVYALLELMLGGKPGNGELPARGPTEIEKQLLSTIMRTMTGELQRAWQANAPLTLIFGGVSSGSHLARVFPGSTGLAAAKFDVTVGERSGALTVLAPANFIAALAEKPVEEIAGSVEESTKPSSGSMLDAQVEVRVWLDDVSMELRDVVQLREGYIVKFDHTPERDLACTLNGEPGFTGQVVSTGRKRAFLIQRETAALLAGKAIAQAC